MKPSSRMLKDVKKSTGISSRDLNAIVKDFTKAMSKHKSAPQAAADIAFSFFLAGNMNAVNFDSEFGGIMSPFLKED